MSWRTRKQDIYTNNGKVTTTTITNGSAEGFWSVTQFVKVMGQQGIQTFEGVFRQDEAEERFRGLIDQAHQETVKAPGHQKVLAGVIDEEDS